MTILKKADASNKIDDRMRADRKKFRAALLAIRDRCLVCMVSAGPASSHMGAIMCIEKICEEALDES